MAREFKPVRFFVMMALAAFVVCGLRSILIAPLAVQLQRSGLRMRLV